LGVSTALRYSDLSRITWEMVLGKQSLLIKEKKTGKMREIPLQDELVEILYKVYLKLGSPNVQHVIIPLHIRTINKQIKIHAVGAGVKGKRISTHTWRKTFGREVWRRNEYSDLSLIKLSLLFNHSSTAITRTYLDITKQEVHDLYDIQNIFIY
jgi:integrase